MNYRNESTYIKNFFFPNRKVFQAPIKLYANHLSGPVVHELNFQTTSSVRIPCKNTVNSADRSLFQSKERRDAHQPGASNRIKVHADKISVEGKRDSPDWYLHRKPVKRRPVGRAIGEQRRQTSTRKRKRRNEAEARFVELFHDVTI